MARGNWKFVATLVASTIVAASSAQATLIAYDGFDYTAGESLVGKSGGVGMQGAWSLANPGNGGLNSANVVAGLTFSDYPVAGNAAEVLTNYQSGDNYDGVTAARQINLANPLPSNSTVYAAMLFRHVENPSFANGSTLSVGSTESGGQNRLIARPVAAFGDDNPDKVATGAGNEATDSPTAGILIGETYLIVAKFTGLNQPDFSNAVNTATLWALSAANYDAIKGGGITEAELDANSVARAFRSDGPSDFGSYLAQTDFLRLSATTAYGINNRSVFDEVKLATQLGDVVPVPEPTSALALGAVALTGLRRKR